MRIAICEDDFKAQAQLEAGIKDWADARKINVAVMCYPSAEAFMLAWSETSFDLIFLDIQMKKMTGIELAEYIRKSDKNILIVFITSFKQYALSGYDVNALHYLIKPLSVTKLLPVLDKAHVIWNSRQTAVILVSDGAGQMKIPYDDIHYISMNAHTAKIHTAKIHTDKKTYEIRKTADELEQSLPNYFIRCHRSFIINLFKADCVYKDSILVSNGETIPVSRKNTKAVNDAFVRLHTGS